MSDCQASVIYGGGCTSLGAYNHSLIVMFVFVHPRIANVNGTASSPKDYTSLGVDNHIKVFAANEALKCVKVTIVDDKITEHDKQFYLSLSTDDPAVRLGQHMLNITIVNDDYGMFQHRSQSPRFFWSGTIHRVADWLWERYCVSSEMDEMR